MSPLLVQLFEELVDALVGVRVFLPGEEMREDEREQWESETEHGFNSTRVRPVHFLHSCFHRTEVL